MAGRFRGAVGKLSKPTKSRATKRAKGKKTVALVKRAPKLSQVDLQQRVAELTSGVTSKSKGVDFSNGADAEAGPGLKVRSKIKSQLTKGQSAKTLQKPMGKATIEIIGRKTERVVPKTEVAAERSPAEAIGLKLLHRAVKNQSHNRLLPHQNRHDYEYCLRTVATTGVVRLFNSLAEARKAGVAVETEGKHLTADKALEKKQMATKEAFLTELCRPRKVDRY